MNISTLVPCLHHMLNAKVDIHNEIMVSKIGGLLKHIFGGQDILIKFILT